MVRWNFPNRKGRADERKQTFCHSFYHQHIARCVWLSGMQDFVGKWNIERFLEDFMARQRDFQKCARYVSKEVFCSLRQHDMYDRASVFRTYCSVYDVKLLSTFDQSKICTRILSEKIRNCTSSEDSHYFNTQSFLKCTSSQQFVLFNVIADVGLT